MANHSRTNPNARMKKIMVGDTPHLCLFAIRDIMNGEHLTYDYGIPEEQMPWIKVCMIGKCRIMSDNNMLFHCFIVVLIHLRFYALGPVACFL